MNTMTALKGVRVWLGAITLLGTALGCSGEAGSELVEEDVAEVSNELTAQQRLTACQQDPRVIAGLVSKEICAGADIFFRETFNGNGRTCGSCHPVANNTTLDVPFITQLRATNPNDPLFVFETNPALANLETSDLLNFAAILENVDGFQDPTHRFVSRSVSHVLSLATSIARDPADGTSSPPVERVGWSGDGAPGDGSLRSFLEGAIKQHFTKDLARRPNVDFRTPTAQEADLTRAFQLSLGRLNELNLTQVRIFDTEGEDGRQAFMDPNRGRCNVCHFNAGANFQDSGKNRNLDNGVRMAGSVNLLTLGELNGVMITDAGFGGQNLTSPNVDANGIGFNNGFGNLTFNPPPLIEAADTAPFFHNSFKALSNTPDDIDNAVRFYAGVAFGFSLGGQMLEQRFGTPLNLFASDAFAISKFLRILNGALNIDIAKQRLSAANTLVGRFQNTRVDVQKKLMELAVVEIDDAIQVLSERSIYPTAQQRLNEAKVEIALGLTAPNWWTRQNRVANAISRCLNARDLFGSNINYSLGTGNLMY